MLKHLFLNNKSMHLVKTIFVLFIFILIGSGIYSNSLHCPFVLDDQLIILDQKQIQITRLNPENLWKAAFGESFSFNRPLPNVTFALNYYFHRFDLPGYHIVNILVHILTGFFLYLFIEMTISIMEGRVNKSGNPNGCHSTTVHACFGTKEFVSFYIALFASLIWFVNPLHTQSVTYIVQRQNSMAGMFFVLSLLLYVKSRISHPKKSNTQRNKVYIVCSFIAWVFALGCKQNTITLPFFVFLYEFYFFQDLDWTWLKGKVKYLIGIIIVFALITILYLGFDPLEKISSLRDFAYKEFTVWERLITQSRVVVYYLSLIFYPNPSRLNLDYDFHLSHSLIDPITTLLSLVLIVFLIALAFYLAKEHRLISFCILWFFGNLVVESSILPLAIIFEHRTYIPSMSIGLLSVLIIHKCTKTLWLKVGLFCAVIALFSLWTYQRNIVWESAISLWKDCSLKSPGKNRPKVALAFSQGVSLQLAGRYEEAILKYNEVLKMEPNEYEAYYNMANIYLKMDEVDKATAFFKEILKTRPDYDKALINLGQIMAKKGMHDKAIEYFEQALKINPHNAAYHNNMGLSLVELGRFDEAARHFEASSNINNEYNDFLYTLGLQMSEKGMYDKAIEYFKKALIKKPHEAKYHNGMGATLSNLGRFDEAISQYEETLNIDPEYIEAYKGMGMALAYQGKYKEAIDSFQKAIKIDPEYAEAHTKMGIVLTYMSRYEEAINEFNEAIRIDSVSAEAYLAKGSALANMGETDKAVFNLSEALKIDPDYIDAHLNMGVILAQAERYTEAEEHLREVLSLDPDNIQAKETLDFVMAGSMQARPPGEKKGRE